MDSDSKDPLLTDVNSKFIGCMEQFQKSTKVHEYAIIFTYACVHVYVYVCMCVLVLLCSYNLPSCIAIH